MSVEDGSAASSVASMRPAAGTPPFYPTAMATYAHRRVEVRTDAGGDVAGSRKEREELLEKVSMFSALNKKEVGRLAAVADERRVPSGTVLTKEGEPGDEFYVVAEGMAQASIKGRKVGSIPAGSFFGELSLLDEGPRTATVTAELPTRLVVITAKDFGRVLDDVPAISLKIMRGLASRIRQADEDWG
jgi:CRP-like cAMP-binding protein